MQTYPPIVFFFKSHLLSPSGHLLPARTVLLKVSTPTNKQQRASFIVTTVPEVDVHFLLLAHPTPQHVCGFRGHHMAEERKPSVRLCLRRERYNINQIISSNDNQS